jgi:gliding motility-associated-like protein
MKVSPPTDTSYYVIATDLANGCTIALSDTSDVTVHENPVANGNTIDLLYNTDTLLNLTVSGGTGIYDYLWTPADSLLPFNDTLANPRTVKLLGDSVTSLATFIATVTDGNGCYDTALVIVDIYGGPLVVDAFTGSVSDSVICQGDSVTLIPSVSGGSGVYQFSWTSNPAGFIATDSVVRVAPNTTSWYIIEVYDGYNYVYDSIPVKVNALPPVSAGADSVICSNDTITLTATGASFYNWNTGANTQSIIVIPTDTTRYIVWGTDLNNCTASDTVMVYAQTRPSVSIHPIDTIRYYNDTVLTAIVTGGTGNYLYTWTPADSLLANNIANPRTITLTQNNTFYLTVTDGITGCTDTASEFIVVAGIPLDVIIDPIDNPNPDINNITDEDTAICLGDILYLFAGATGGTGNYTYTWSSIPAGFTASDAVVTVQPAIPSISYIVEVSDGIESIMDTINVITYMPPVAVAQPQDTSVFPGTEIQLYASGGDRYYWTPESYVLDAPTTQNPLVKPYEATNFIVRVEYDQVFATTNETITCIDFDTVHVAENDFQVFVPEAFTPNGDGINDILYVKTIGIAEINFKLFNKWGEMVFKTTDEEIGWDGSYKGKIQGVQTFGYILEFTDMSDNDYTQKGQVSIFR